MLINVSLFKLMPYRLRKALKFEVRVRLNRREFKIPASIEDGIQNVFWTKSWKTEIIERLVDRNKGIFVDVGANVGQTLLDLHLVHPKTDYVGFEPNCACASYLKELIQINSIQNCQIVPVGLADRVMCMPLFRHKDALTDSCGSIISDLRPSLKFDVDIVPCFKFDDVRQSLDLGEIGFVKIDVEGAELETLTGMEMSVRECQPIILCEVLFTDSKADLSAKVQRNAKLRQLLTSMRYKVLQLVKSADTTHIVNVNKIQEFPSAHWSLDNKELCDYLFIPEDKETYILNSLLAKR